MWTFLIRVYSAVTDIFGRMVPSISGVSMDLQGYFRTLTMCLLVLEIRLADSNRVRPCHHTLKVPHDKHVEFQLTNFTGPRPRDRQVYCTVLISTEPGLRIVMDLLYQPAHDERTLSNLNCTKDYVHVGNDHRRVDMELMTSYKFCREHVQQELLSRGERMWLVYKASKAHAKIQFDLYARSPVTCTEDEFSCSPVQCVHKSRVCDGVKDCSNGHDEFCHRKDMHSPPSALDKPCFKCGDGTCILPRRPRYDVNHARVLWYLCDGFAHCPDGWDERKEICMNLEKGRVGAVTECVPFDLQFGPRGVVTMWNIVQCDGHQDCYHREDEEDCGGQDSQSRLHAEPETIAIVCAGLFIILVLAAVVFRILDGSQPLTPQSRTSATETLCTICSSGDRDDTEVDQNALGASCENTDTCQQSAKNTTV